MPNRYPEAIRKLNDLLQSDLGSQPRYAWRWSEDLVHVLEVLDLDGNPLYVEGRPPQGIITMMPKTATKPLLPEHHNQWVMCALVEVNSYDGSIHGTGNHAWVPVAGASGVVCLPENQKPDLGFTQMVIDAIRQTRKQSATEFTAEYEEGVRERERKQWTRNYEIIREQATAFANVPGMKGHVSFPTPSSMIQ